MRSGLKDARYGGTGSAAAQGCDAPDATGGPGRELSPAWPLLRACGGGRVCPGCGFTWTSTAGRPALPWRDDEHALRGAGRARPVVFPPPSGDRPGPGAGSCNGGGCAPWRVRGASGSCRAGATGSAGRFSSLVGQGAAVRKEAGSDGQHRHSLLHAGLRRRRARDPRHLPVVTPVRTPRFLNDAFYVVPVVGGPEPRPEANDRGGGRDRPRLLRRPPRRPAHPGRLGPGGLRGSARGAWCGASQGGGGAPGRFGPREGAAISRVRSSGSGR